MKFKSLFSQAAVMLAVAASLYLITKIYTDFNAKAGVRLQSLWEEDIQNLLAQNKLPSTWKKISQVEKIAARNDLIAESWVKTVSAPIEINPEGEYKLEILFLSQKENGHESAVIQHHLIHIPTGNSVWEIGRTYHFD